MMYYDVWLCFVVDGLDNLNYVDIMYLAYMSLVYGMPGSYIKTVDVLYDMLEFCICW